MGDIELLSVVNLFRQGVNEHRPSCTPRVYIRQHLGKTWVKFEVAELFANGKGFAQDCLVPVKDLIDAMLNHGGDDVEMPRRIGEGLSYRLHRMIHSPEVHHD